MKGAIMAGYQYGTSPRKIEPEYRRTTPKKKTIPKKVTQNKNKTSKSKKKKKKRCHLKLSFL